jgi:hypothetical protein
MPSAEQSNESFTMLHMLKKWAIYTPERKDIIVSLPFPLHGIKHLEQ